MPDPALTQQQRHLLRTFRNASQTRSQAEQAAETRRKSEQAATTAAFKQAQETAQATLKKSTADSESRHAAELNKADRSLGSVDTYCTGLAFRMHSGVLYSNYAERAQDALKKANLQSLIEVTQPQPTTIGVNPDPQREFSTLVTTSKDAFANFEVDLKQLTEIRQQAAQRRKLFWQVVGVAAVVLLIGGFLSWQIAGITAFILIGGFLSWWYNR